VSEGKGYRVRLVCDMGHEYESTDERLIGAGNPPACPECSAAYLGTGTYPLRPKREEKPNARRQ
jgi:hypothetical protein